MQKFQALASFLAPFPVSRFLEEYWERAPLHIVRDDARPLISLADLDSIITTGLHHHPDLQMVNASREVHVEDYANVDTGVVDTASAIKRFSEGASFVLNALDDWSPKIRELCVRLEAELGIMVQANLYFTPGGAQGFPTHYDNHDVIIVQCEGRKAWRLYDSPKGLPMRGERFIKEETPCGPLSATFETKAGDSIYIPRGLMHDAVAVDGEASLHVTVGLHAVRWSEVIVEAVAQAALADPELRRGMPFGALMSRVAGEDDALAKTIEAHVARAARAVSWAPIRSRLVERFMNDHKESLGGMLAGVAAPSADATYELRPGVLVVVDSADGATELIVNGRTTRWPEHAESTLRRAIELGRFSIEDLGDDLDRDGRVTLARRLVVEGALRLVQR